ncbi:MAG: M16 family metallopeptidase [bacterium]
MKAVKRAVEIAMLFFLLLTLASLESTCLARVPTMRFEPLKFEIPEVDTLYFENGLHGYLIEDHEIPAINIVIMFRSAYPTDDKVGLPELATWAIRNGGSSKYTKSRIDDELEFVGASIESSGDGISGSITANFLTKDTRTVMDIFADLIINPAFDPEKVDLRKKTMIEEIRRKADDPLMLGIQEFSKLIYKGHPVALDPTVETIMNISHDDIIDFHRKYVRPQNAVIGITGDISKDEAMALINEYLGGWHEGGETPVFPEMAFELRPSVNYIYKDLNQAYIFVGHMSINYANPDRPIANIMNYILGGGSFTSWITRRVRAEEGLAYHAACYLRASAWGYGTLTATCQTRCDAAMRALGIIIDQMKRMKEIGPTPQEVEDAKQYFINSEVFNYESNQVIMSRLVWLDLAGLPLDMLQRDFEAYQRTTVEDVKRVAREYLYPGQLTILVVGDKDKFDRPLSDFGEVEEIEIKGEVRYE